mmetsp:Transcript_13980/g.24516  ORF Transcript_13980/g.24516 Transcript_13980/m.24516 type:complete len:336 (-) Transcript_13980:941-1948(-)
MDAMDGMEMMSTVAQSRFQANEKAYVPHTDKFYEAKILKTEYRGASGWFYFLHYTGWNKKFDEWVEEAGLVKADVAEAAGAGVNVANKARKVGGPTGPQGFGGGMGSTGSAMRPSAAGGLAGPAALMGPGARGPRGAAGVGAALPPLGGSAYAGSHMNLDIEIPPIIKKYLVDDHDCVVEEGRLLPLPRYPSIIETMEQYVAQAKELRPGTVDAEEEVSHGLQSYFDKCLLPLLLYGGEREQAGQVLADGRMPSAVYGPEHLARLLVRLPDILPLGALTDDMLATVATMVQDVMQWMADHHTTLFLPKEGYLPAGAQQAVQQAAVQHTRQLLGVQ